MLSSFSLGIFVVMLMGASGKDEDAYFSTDRLLLDQGTITEIWFFKNFTSQIGLGWDNTTSILVNITFTSNNSELLSVLTETTCAEITDLEHIVNITLEVETFQQDGETEISADVTWTDNGTLASETYTIRVTVVTPGLLEMNFNYPLIYLNMVVAFISIIFVGCDVSPNDVMRTWGKTSVWVFAGFLVYALIRPLLTLIIVKMFHFSPPASVGLLAAMCSPPSLLAIPVTSVLRGDVALVSVLALAADIIGAAVLPMWVLQFGRMDPNIKLEASQVAYSVIILYFLLPLVALVCGMIIRRMRPDNARSMSRISPLVCFMTLLIASTLDIYNLSDTVRFVDAATGIFGSLEPLAVLLILFLVAAFLRLDQPRMKALAAFLLIKGQSVSVATLTNAEVKEDQFLSIAACSYLCLLCLLVAMVLACIQCLCARSLDPDRDQFAEELVTEIEDEEEAPFYSFGSRQDSSEKKPPKVKGVLLEKLGLLNSWVWM